MCIRTLRCSFCRKTEEQVTKLVAGAKLIFGGKLHICDECVAVGNSITQGKSQPASAVARRFLKEMKECWRHLVHRPVPGEAMVA